jgi:hypothetical protein
VHTETLSKTQAPLRWDAFAPLGLLSPLPLLLLLLPMAHQQQQQPWCCC